MKLFMCHVAGLGIAAVIWALPQANGSMLPKNETLPSYSDPLLHASIRARAPCARHDIPCWCKKAKDYTNKVRRKHIVRKMLRLGPEAQLANANRYARYLAKRGSLKHQTLTKVTKEVGCQRWMGGENLAFNDGHGDFAKTCVQQWVGSKPHFENLIRDWLEEVVVGFYFDRYGRVFCVQRFSVVHSSGTFGRTTDKGCEQVSSASESKDGRKKELQGKKSGDNDENPLAELEAEAEAQTEDDLEDGDVATRSCRCLSLGRGCWESLASQTDSKCLPRTSRKDQLTGCKTQCCEHCDSTGFKKRCSDSHVQRLCRKL